MTSDRSISSTSARTVGDRSAASATSARTSADSARTCDGDAPEFCARAELQTAKRHTPANTTRTPGSFMGCLAVERSGLEPRDGARRGPAEKRLRHERFDHLATHVAFEVPETARLVRRESQARHLQEFRPHALHDSGVDDAI